MFEFNCNLAISIGEHRISLVLPPDTLHDLFPPLNHIHHRVLIEVCDLLVPELVVGFVLVLPKLCAMLWPQQGSLERG